MSPRVPTAFRPLEMMPSTAGTSPVQHASLDDTVPAYTGPYEHERLLILSRLEQRWSSPKAGCYSGSGVAQCRSDCVAPVPRKSFTSARSVPSSLSSDEDAACMELRGIFGHADNTVPSASSRSSSATSSVYSTNAVDQQQMQDGGIFPLEEIVIRSCSPISRSSNPMPMDAGFGAPF